MLGFKVINLILCNFIPECWEIWVWTQLIWVEMSFFPKLSPWWCQLYDPSYDASQVPETGCNPITMMIYRLSWTNDQQMRPKTSVHALHIGITHKNLPCAHDMSFLHDIASKLCIFAWYCPSVWPALDLILAALLWKNVIKTCNMAPVVCCAPIPYLCVPLILYVACSIGCSDMKLFSPTCFERKGA